MSLLNLVIFEPELFAKSSETLLVLILNSTEQFERILEKGECRVRAEEVKIRKQEEGGEGKGKGRVWEEEGEGEATAWAEEEGTEETHYQTGPRNGQRILQ